MFRYVVGFVPKEKKRKEKNGRRMGISARVVLCL